MIKDIFFLLLQITTIIVFCYSVYKGSKRKSNPPVEIDTSQVRNNIDQKEQDIKNSGEYNIPNDIDITVKSNIMFLLGVVPSGVLTIVIGQKMILADDVIIKFLIFWAFFLALCFFLQFLILCRNKITFTREGVTIRTLFKSRFYEYKDIKMSIQERAILYNVDIVFVILVRKGYKTYEFNPKIYPGIIGKVQKLSGLVN